MRPSDLHIVAMYSNPMRTDVRPTLYRRWERHMLEAGVQLHVVDLAHRDHDWQISTGPHHSADVDYIQLRCNTIMWHKENAINQGLRHVPRTAKGIGWFDTDIHFRDINWPLKILDALQHHEVVQPWTSAIDLGPRGQLIHTHKSFASMWMNGEPTSNVVAGKYQFGHPGYAWAARPSFLAQVGGLIDRAILGAADHHMALAMTGQGERSIKDGVTPAYRKMVLDWEELAVEAGGFNLGATDDVIEHSWHGRKSDRRYVERWDILIRNRYDPFQDIIPNMDGIFELRHGGKRKTRLRHQIQQYFRARQEDANVI